MNILFKSNTLYIEPITSCNLKCKMCYTNVLNGKNRKLLDSNTICNFIDRWINEIPNVDNIYWCGTGEVFLHKEFPYIVNKIQDKYNINQIIQTNGTIDRLKEFTNLSNIDFRVSIDGIKIYHEWNRGIGTYNKCINFCRNALNNRSKSVSIRMLITNDNILCLDDFRSEIDKLLSPLVQLSIIVPYDKQLIPTIKKTNNYPQISKQKANDIISNIFNKKYQIDDNNEIENYISINPYGVYTCCEGIIRIGDITNEISQLITNMKKSTQKCYKCPMFPCV